MFIMYSLIPLAILKKHTIICLEGHANSVEFTDLFLYRPSDNSLHVSNPGRQAQHADA